MAESIPILPYDTIGTQLQSLLIAIGNKLEREWPASRPAHPGTSTLLRSLVLVSANTYRTMTYFCADLPPDPSRKLEYALTASPLARTILDTLVTIVFLFEKLEENTNWYYKSGWRESKAENSKYHEAYGIDPAWTEFLARHDGLIIQLEHQFNITSEEINDPSIIKWWPTPSQMLKNPLLSEDRKSYLQYLNDWFMRELSQDSHLSWPGLG